MPNGPPSQLVEFTPLRFHCHDVIIPCLMHVQCITLPHTLIARSLNRPLLSLIFNPCHVPDFSAPLLASAAFLTRPSIHVTCSSEKGGIGGVGGTGSPSDIVNQNNTNEGSLRQPVILDNTEHDQNYANGIRFSACLPVCDGAVEITVHAPAPCPALAPIFPTSLTTFN